MLSVPGFILGHMVTPPMLVRSGPPRWHSWVLRTLYNFQRIAADDWLGLIRHRIGVTHPGGPAPMATARDNAQLMNYLITCRDAASLLAKHGHHAGRTHLALAATDLTQALSHLEHARDALLEEAGADRVTDHD
ncbi:hypothetical protein E3G54_004954 [Mycobacteroides abscessus]|nr:hypothetical protein [Mycobacteroides abscessus]